MKRVGIFFFYDNEGIADTYVFYYLSAIAKHCTTLYIVVNGSLTDTSKKEFEKLATEVLIRPNTGFDVGAYKYAIEYIGWPALRCHDELLLMNYTNYGPVDSFDKMFETMDQQKDLDFWGITKHFGHDNDPYGLCEYYYIPLHIQSSFIAVRKKMLLSVDFKNYWDTMPFIHSYEESICFHEAVFTKKFTDLGYKSDTYVKTDDLKNHADYTLMLYPTELVKNRGCEIFKRKTFYNLFTEYADISCGQPASDFYKYLRAETKYDTNLIWDNLLRTSNMYDILMRMQLNYCLSKTSRESNFDAKNESQKIAAVVSVYDLTVLINSSDYFKNLPAQTEFFIAAPEKKLLDDALSFFEGMRYTIAKASLENADNLYAYPATLMDSVLQNYDFVCVVNTKTFYLQKPYMIGDSISYHDFENTLGSVIFVENILHTFVQNSRLGILMPPIPFCYALYPIIGNEWLGNYQETAALLGRSLSKYINEKIPPLASYGGMFWARPAALKGISALFLSSTDTGEKEPPSELLKTLLHPLDCCYSPVAQSNGYYTAWTMTTSYAPLAVNSLYRAVKDINTNIFARYGVKDRYSAIGTVWDGFGQVHSPAHSAVEFPDRIRTRIKWIMRLILGKKISTAIHLLRVKLTRGKANE